ncbi:MAG: toll/interleukin-1 receptor domain-containing protein [Pseudomonadota bacterium]
MPEENTNRKITTVNVFLSYSSQNHAYADLVVSELHNKHVTLEPNSENMLEHAFRARIEIWRDTKNIEYGDRWPREIDTRLKSCDALITILTSAACQSNWVTYEWCVATDNGDTEAKFIPMMFEDCKPHPKMRSVQQFEARNQLKDWEGLRRKLASLSIPASYDRPEDEALPLAQPEPVQVQEVATEIAKRIAALNTHQLDPDLQQKIAEMAKDFEAVPEPSVTTEDLIDRQIAALSMIESYLSQKGFTRISFERLRRLFGYEEAFLVQLVAANPDKLRMAWLKNPDGHTPRRGLARLGGSKPALRDYVKS